MSFVLEKVYENCPENKGKVLFYETYFDMGNINQKPLIWSNYKKITKFGPKKCFEFGFGQSVRKQPEIKVKSYFMKPTSKRVI